MKVDGVSIERFAGVRDKFQQNLESGADLGASLCITVNGEAVLDIWGGWAEEGRAKPWQRDTIVNVYSSTKIMMALTVLLLNDRGVLDYDDKVARVWPEFAANGKGDVRIRDLMTHTAGLPGWTQKMSREDLYDWEKCTNLLAAQALEWPSGSQYGYHGVTQGFLVGEVVRRITGKTLGTIFRDEIAGPLGADFFIGLPASEDYRVADLVPPAAGEAMGEGLEGIPVSPSLMNMMTNPGLLAGETRKRAWRGAELGAVGGTGNARGMAEILAILANGGVAKGRRFLSETACRRALDVEFEGRDSVSGIPIKVGVGFGLKSDAEGYVIHMPNPNSVWGGGYGGSLLIADYDSRASFGYSMNRMCGGLNGMSRGINLAQEMWKALRS